LTVMSIPLNNDGRRGHRWASSNFSISLKGSRIHISSSWVPSWKRILCVALGIAYPTIILIAILATANHFILDAVAGAVVCGVAWYGNDFLFNLLVVEDWFLYLFRFTFTERGGEVEEEGEGSKEGIFRKELEGRY
jgi:hypothetical protein